MDGCYIPHETFKNKSEAIKPISSSEEMCVPNHSWGAGVRSLYIIHYIVDGCGTFWCGTKKYHLEKGQIFVIFPSTIVKYQADSENPWHYIWVTFTGNESKEILSQMGLNIHNPTATVKNPNLTLEALRRMPRERSSELSENLNFSARLYEFLSTLAPTETEDAENPYLSGAKRYIKAHYFEDITVESVASHIGISRKYLFALFKEGLSVSPKDYIIDYRIKRAEEFLLDKNLSIGNVAYSVGYHDPLTFSKSFKLKTGLSPTEYREKYSK